MARMAPEIQSLSSTSSLIKLVYFYWMRAYNDDYLRRIPYSFAQGIKSAGAMGLAV